MKTSFKNSFVHCIYKLNNEKATSSFAISSDYIFWAD